MRRSVVVFVDDVGGECRVGGLEGREGRKEGRGVPVNWIRMKGGEGKGGEGLGLDGGGELLSSSWMFMYFCG